MALKENLLPKRTAFLWQIRIGGAGLIFIIALCGFSFLTRWLFLAAAVLTALLAVLLFWYLPRYFKSYEILFPKGAVVINRGVFIKTTHIMPFSRLVYAQSFATPLAKRMGLAALTLKAARSRIIIPELNASDVNYFIDFLTKEGEA